MNVGFASYSGIVVDLVRSQEMSGGSSFRIVYGEENSCKFLFHLFIERSLIEFIWYPTSLEGWRHGTLPFPREE